MTAVIGFVAAVAGFAVWFIRKRRAGAQRYKMLPRFGDHADDDDNEPGSGGLLPVYDTSVADEEDPHLAAEMENRSKQQREDLPTVVSPSPLNIQGDDGAPAPSSRSGNIIDL